MIDRAACTRLNLSTGLQERDSLPFSMVYAMVVVIKIMVKQEGCDVHKIAIERCMRSKIMEPHRKK